MVQIIMNILLLILLLICSWMDIKRKTISGILLCVFAIIGIMLNVIFRPVSLAMLVSGMAVGAVVLVVSKLTKEQIGMGDGSLLCITGLYMGFYKNLEMFLSALFLAAVWGIVLLIIRKGGRKTEIPFVPFMMLSYVCMMIT